MDKDKKISISVIKRLPRYYRYLAELIDKDVVRISSKELSKKMNITASQIRQDLNNFGCFGQQGYGYHVENLHREIGKILGLERKYKMIIVGAGNIGRALVNYENFKNMGFEFVSIFDVDENLIGKDLIPNVKVRHIRELDEFLEKTKIDIAVLSMPRNKAKEIGDLIANHGVKGIWNFSNIDLEFESTIVENVHLTDSLMTLAYQVSNHK